MATPRDIDTLLKHWDFQPGEANARLIKAKNGRDVLQMRIDMGVLQMETAFRPDGLRPHGAETYFDYLVGEVIREGEFYRDARPTDVFSLQRRLHRLVEGFLHPIGQGVGQDHAILPGAVVLFPGCDVAARSVEVDVECVWPGLAPDEARDAREVRCRVA